MPNSNLISTLEAELENAKAEKKALEARIFRIEAFLKQEKETIPQGLTTNLSFQDRVRAAVRQSPKGIRPQFIVDHLKEVGFEMDGSSPISVRVANELARLVRQGELEKVERGVYRVAN